MLAEEFLRRRLDAENAGAEIDAVEIEREDLVLGVARLQIEREHRFLHLALEGAAGIEEQILGQLLGQGRAALHHMARHHVLARRRAPGRWDRCRNDRGSGGPRWR